MVVAVTAGGALASTGPSRVLKLVSTTSQFTPIWFSPNSNTPPPVRASYIIGFTLFNPAPQFGKPAGASVGGIELQCVVASSLRDMCNGVAHLPNGFLTFSNPQPQNGGAVSWYAITGGVAGYE